MTIDTRKFTEIKESFTRGKDTLSFSTGKIAVIADGSVTISFNDNVFLVTSVMNKDPDAGKDYMPLMIDFRESFSAAGKIGGGRFRKREGRPSDEAILYSRMTDRSMRPLFPKGMVNDLIISLSPLALDLHQDLGVMSIIGASVATTLAGVPYAGPVGAVRIGYMNGEYIINPTKKQIEEGELNLLVAGPRDSINMIEADGREVSNDILEKAWDIAIEHINQVIDRQEAFTSQVEISNKSDKVVFNKPSTDVIDRVATILTDDVLTVVTRKDTRKEDFGEIYAELESKVLVAGAEKMANDESGDYTKHNLKTAVFTVLKAYIRKNTINDAVRLDGRTPMDIRPLYCEVDVVPQVHGSGLFWRGDTQVLASTTLGSPSDGELKDSMEATDVTNNFLHHYNFPPFSVNDARGTRGA
jgi:polyribonucleotide nucleotidyltransferase